jgi:hypothetical protein
LAWPTLSFSDASISVIRDRIRDGVWQYHDTETGTWREGGAIQRERLGLHSGVNGPLFFEHNRDGLRLRYSSDALRRFGLPVRELVWILARRTSATGVFPVAGQLPDGGLWIEIAPGRLVSVPASLLVMSVEGREYSLSHLHWDGFASGDTVTLGLASSDPMTIDRIALVDTHPGPRAELGRRAYLPFVSSDERRGVTQLGAGDLILNVPVVWDHDTPPPTIIVHDDNRLEDPAERLPVRGDVVLLGLDAAGVPVVLGLPGLKPMARWEDPECWRGDPLAVELAAPDTTPPARS